MGFGFGLFLVWLITMAGSVFQWMTAGSAGWRATQAWKYKNPDAAEPSAAAFTMRRVGAVLFAVGWTAGLLVTYFVLTSKSGSSSSPHPWAT
ncbi:hypothetical protein ACPA54_21705 [Uniformispora flossi]|uniref:hypothetical protein n=1 Tax=Uniformispora flossi TaxID=3390723 RepID=UPI003C2C29AE